MTFPRADYQPARRLIPTMRVVVESFLGLVGIFLVVGAAYGQNVGGTGGSSGSGGGGSVTQGTIPWVEALSTTPSIANGNGVVPTQGGSALSATNGGYTNLLQGNAAIASGNPLFAQLVAGSAIAGKFGIDQTTAGTTNGISIVGVNAATALAGAGAVGAGAQRVAVGQDATTLAGSAPGTAGSPSTQVVSVQGVSSGTPQPVNGTVTSQFSTANAAATPHICGSSVFKHITTMTDTQILAASGSTNIYICDYEISFNGTGNLYLEKATSGTCATLTQISQAWYGIANSGKAAGNPFYRGLNTGASAQLCANTSAAITVDITVYYDQY